LTTPASALRLAFVSPVFLFPNNTGGRIRTTNILRGLKGGAFHVTLVGPASDAQRREWAGRLDEVCDRFVPWRAARSRPRWTRALDLFGDLPFNVAADRTQPALQTVAATLGAEHFDVVVFDFVHAAVLVPPALEAPTVCFTHNVEAEIFARHAAQPQNPLLRSMWSSQHAKMTRFEREALQRFTAVVAVSDRDAEHFRAHYGIAAPQTIPTGVDLDFFEWRLPPPPAADAPATVVFIGSMDWTANVDGVRHFIDEVWPRVRAAEPKARFVVVGRNPPASLVSQARAAQGVELTGFVDDVRPYARTAQASVIPLRVGGGTRIKAFEAMALGCPVVSTSVGIEGLDVRHGEHYLRADDPAAQAAAVLSLLREAPLREALSRRARHCVEQRFGHRVAAGAFERACLWAIDQRRRVALKAG
jgi:glycosyltransferase involved in cell wall biosynthesis